MLTLGIETSGKTASAAVMEDGIMLGQTSVLTAKTHSQVILPMVKKLIADCERDIKDVGQIAVGAGPGSYTGIRIGVAAVKAMAFSLGIQCCGISTLEGLAYNFPADGIVCPVMKARQKLVYAAVFRFCNGVAERLADDMIIESEKLDNILKGYNDKIILTGDSAESFAEEFANPLYRLSPAHLRNQNAAGICLAAENHGFYSPEKLEASYLQLVKAEKDLIKSQAG
ncbi:MAG: tRNA (adenosine(37)-N6)-threonylcarbamoyltransferase complex dimerization subunit type 1 TsaB [Oscillospiraceae bacterium]|nr:tRNA (adenosine(37)-N6)-threonylcarbamoyltransferase complex dimerization subunit type 1 TsaB [Oscillospiraceae bacterium]